METRLVIFDYDGVIADSLPMIREVYDLIAMEFKVAKPVGFEYYKDFFELDYRRTLQKWNIMSEEDIAKVNLIFNREVRRREKLIKPFFGMKELLAELRKDYKIAIASNNFRANLVPALKEHKLISYFDEIIGIEDGLPKPHPDLLHKVMSRLGQSPEHSVFIGDMDGDIMAGKAAKLKKTIAVSDCWHDFNRLKDADVIVSKPEVILEAVIC